MSAYASFKVRPTHEGMIIPTIIILYVSLSNPYNP